MPLWECDQEDCKAPSIRIDGDCQLCNRHLCLRHLREDHACPKWEDEQNYMPASALAESREIAELISRINIEALAARASFLRGGTPSHVATLAYDRATSSKVMGGMNYHIPVEFPDNKVWLARVRRFNATSPPPILRDYIIQSEAASLYFLEQAIFKTPRIFDVRIEGPENSIGVGYILMEKLPGHSLQWGQQSQEHTQKLVDQMAEIMIELSNHPMDAMGSLVGGPAVQQVAGFARESTSNVHGSRLETLGPCRSLTEYLTKSVKFNMDLILRQEMYAERAIDAYLIHLFLLEIVPRIAGPLADLDDGRFYLKHADDKGDHILVDDEYNITGIVDWEWAFTASKSLAFIPPLVFFNVGEFYDGINELGPQERMLAQAFETRGRADLAEIVRRSKPIHRFLFCCGYDLEDWAGFLGLFRGLRDIVGADRHVEWAEWKAVAMGRYGDDEGLQTLVSGVSET